jgi:hypothetical protein
MEELLGISSFHNKLAQLGKSGFVPPEAPTRLHQVVVKPDFGEGTEVVVSGD